MPCYHPIAAFRTAKGDVYFGAEIPESVSGSRSAPLTLPCGQCVGCRLERSRQWAVRCMHESSLHTRNSFVTLTFSDRWYSPSLWYPDFQRFLKRLRRSRCGPWFGSLSAAYLDAAFVGEAEAFAGASGTEAEANARRRERLRERRRVRFVACGEYGDHFRRPHYHALLFGMDFPDRYYWRKSSSGFPLYRSAELERLWPWGHCEVGDVTFESAAYVARYAMKKVTGPHAPIHYREFFDVKTGEPAEVEPEFLTCSLKPGIGFDWIRLFRTDVYRGDGDAYVVVNGMPAKPPRYYDQYMSDVLEFDAVEYYREKRGLRRRDDNTPERLAVREKVAKAGLRFKVRTVE